MPSKAVAWVPWYLMHDACIFTLSVGIGAMEIFGSYQKREHSIPGEAANIVILDTFVALMAGFIIIPACFAYGVQPDGRSVPAVYHTAERI